MPLRNCRPGRPNVIYLFHRKAAKIAPANPRPMTGWIMSAAEALDVLVEELELVAVDEPEREEEEEEEDDEPLDEWEPVEVAWVDLRLPEAAEPIAVPLVLGMILPTEAVPAEAEGIMMAETKVEFWPAGTLAGADWTVAAAG